MDNFTSQAPSTNTSYVRLLATRTASCGCGPPTAARSTLPRGAEAESSQIAKRSPAHKKKTPPYGGHLRKVEEQCGSALDGAPRGKYARRRSEELLPVWRSGRAYRGELRCRERLNDGNPLVPTPNRPHESVPQLMSSESCSAHGKARESCRATVTRNLLGARQCGRASTQPGRFVRARKCELRRNLNRGLNTRNGNRCPIGRTPVRYRRLSEQRKKKVPVDRGPVFSTARGHRPCTVGEHSNEVMPTDRSVDPCFA